MEKGKVEEDWKLELQKSKRGCLLRICNYTDRNLVLRTVSLNSGKWTTGVTISPLAMPTEEENKGSFLRNRPKIKPSSVISFFWWKRKKI